MPQTLGKRRIKVHSCPSFCLYAKNWIKFSNLSLAQPNDMDLYATLILRSKLGGVIFFTICPFCTLNAVNDQHRSAQCLLLPNTVTDQIRIR